MNNDNLRSQYDLEGGPPLHTDRRTDVGMPLIDIFWTAVGFALIAGFVYKLM